MGSVDKCSRHFRSVTNSGTKHAPPVKAGDETIVAYDLQHNPIHSSAKPTTATDVAANTSDVKEDLDEYKVACDLDRKPAILPPPQPSLAITPTAEYAFPVMEASEETDGPTDVKVILPNKARLMPLSIMVCDTISAVRSRTLLKVLFDPGSTTTFISRKCLPRHCKPCPVARTRSVNTLAGSCTANEMVVLRAIRFPELDKNRVIDQHKALVFDGEIRYDLILGADFLTKTGIDIRYSSGTIEWFDSELPMQDPSHLDNNDYLAMAEALEVHREEEQIFGRDWYLSLIHI